jgi:hypothetical protein
MSILNTILKKINDRKHFCEEIDIIEEIKKLICEEKEDYTNVYNNLYKGLYNEWKADNFNINYIFSHSKSLLHHAVECKCEKVVNALIKKGANVNIRGGYYGTLYPLRLAFNNKDIKTINILLENGADQSCIHKPKAVKIGISAGLLFAVATPLTLIYFTQLTKSAVIIATVSSALMIGIIAYGAAYMWSKHVLTSKSSEVDNCSNLLSSVEQPPPVVFNFSR